jgi:hypothetical protein
MVRKYGWSNLARAVEEDIAGWWLHPRDLVPKSHSPVFDSLVLLVARIIWLERNNRVFSRTSLSPAQLVQRLELLLEDWCSVRLVARSMLYRE